MVLFSKDTKCITSYSRDLGSVSVISVWSPIILSQAAFIPGWNEKSVFILQYI